MNRKPLTYLGLLAAVFFLAGCVTISKDSYRSGLRWDPVPSAGFISANVLIQAEEVFTPEYTKLWKDWLNTDENIENYKHATRDALVEDMVRSRVFSRATAEGHGNFDLIVRVLCTESRNHLKIEMSVINPKGGEVLAAYATDKTKDNSQIGNSIRDALADLRFQMLAEYQAGKGIRAFLASAAEKAASAPSPKAGVAKAAVETAPKPSDEKMPPLRQDTFAVVIGIDYKGKPDIPSLNYASQDAKRIYDLLTDPRYGGVPKENATLLLNEKATRNEMVAAFRRIKTWDGYLYVYYSGHGAPKTRQDKIVDGFLIPYDAVVSDPESLEDTSIKMSYLQELTDASQCKGILVALDACFTGGGKSIVAKGGKPLVGVLAATDLIKPRGQGRVFITSSAANQQSWEDDAEFKSGIFSHYLLQGLQGAAGKDLWVSIDDIASYIRENVPKAARKLKGIDQNPQITGKGNFAVVRNWQKAKVMDIDIGRQKLKSAFENGFINADQLSRGIDELKSSRHSKVLDSFLEDSLDARKFGELY